MGRKGVSKRKVRQTKSAPFTGGTSGNGSNQTQPADSQPVTGKTTPTTGGGGKTHSDGKNKGRKG